MLTRKTPFKIFAVVFIFSFSLSQNPSPIKKIEIYGNKNLPYQDLISRIKLNEDIEAIKNEILNIYIYNGFYFANVDSIKIENGILKVFVSEGKQARVGNIEIKGNNVLSDDEIKEALGLSGGEIFRTQTLKNGINKILDKYSNIGYPLAEIEIASVELDENGFVDLKLNINEGRLIKIEQVKVQGNNITKEALILREARIKRGEIYRERKIEQVRKRLIKLGLFEMIYEPEIFFNDTTSGILLKVKEGRMNLFDGIIGYVPQAGSSRGYFMGYINILLKNLFGMGRKFGAKWNSETKETQEFEIFYLEPYVFGLPTSAEVSFYQRKQDSTYITRKPQVNFEIELTSSEKILEIFKASLYIAQTSIIPTATEFITNKIFESRTLNTGVGVIYDARDNVNFPSSGIYFSSFYELGTKKILGPKDMLTSEIKTNTIVNKFKFTLDFYFDFKKILKSVLFSRFNAMIVSGDGIDESDVFRFGGMKSLRGYRENEFLATRAMWANFENRFGLSYDFVVFGFVDVGYIYRPILLPRIMNSFEAIRVGYGLGFKFNTKVGRLNLIYALGKGDSFKTGKIHIGIESEF